MAFYDKFLDFGRGGVPGNAPLWAQFGQGATQQYLRRGYQGARKERARQIGLEGKFYKSRLKGIGAHRKAVKGDFESALTTMRQGIGRTAAARGLGKSTVSLGTGATGQLLLQQQSALGAIDKTRYGEKAAHYERLAGIQPVNSAMWRYMMAKNRYGALENYGASGYSQRGKSPLGSLGGAALGGMTGIPGGSVVGGIIGGMF